MHAHLVIGIAVVTGLAVAGCATRSGAVAETRATETPLDLAFPVQLSIEYASRWGNPTRARQRLSASRSCSGLPMSYHSPSNA